MNEQPTTVQNDPDENAATSSDIVLSGHAGGSNISVALVSAINRNQNYAWSSLKVETREDRLKVAKLLTDKENGIERLLNGGTFDVQDVIIMKASFFDADGTQVTTPRCILISPSGESISIMARVWVTEFISTWLMMGEPPFNPPLTVSAKQVKGTGANRYYTLVLP